MRFLLFPGNNSLSHVAKCLAVGDVLLKKGHNILIAAAGHYSRFLEKCAAVHEIIPDIQEADNSSYPTIS